MALTCEFNTLEIINRIRNQAHMWNSQVKDGEEAVSRINSIDPGVFEDYDEDGKRVRVVNLEADTLEKAYNGGAIIPNSPSQRAKERKAKKYGEQVEGDQRPTSVLAKRRGRYLHDVIAKILEDLSNGKTPTIRDKYDENGVMNITRPHFETLVGTAKAIIAWAEVKQKSIDPTKKANLLIEKFLINTKNNFAGRADLVVILSDGSAVIFDFKTLSPKSSYFDNNGQLIKEELFNRMSEEQYDFQMQDYTSTLDDSYGIPVREVFTVPIVTRYGGADNKLFSLKSYQPPSAKETAENSYLAFNPTIASRPKDNKAKDELIEQILSKIQSLREVSKRVSPEVRRSNAKSIALLKKQLKDLQAERKIDIFHRYVHKIGRDAARLHEQGELSIEKGFEYMKELNAYIGIKNIYEKTLDMHKSPEDFNKVLTDIQDSAIQIKNRIDGILLEKIKKDAFKPQDFNPDGSFKKQKRLNLIERSMTMVGLLDNSFTRAVQRVVNRMMDDARNDAKKDMEMIAEGETAAIVKTGTTKRLYSMLIDREKGTLHSKYSEEFKELMNKLEKREKKDPKGAGKEFKKIMEIKDLEEYKKAYKKSMAKEIEQIEVFLLTKGYDKNSTHFLQSRTRMLEKWQENNNLLSEKSTAAWGDPYVRKKYAKVREDIKGRYLSKEFKKIEVIPEVLAYYNMWTSQMKKIARMLNTEKGEIHQYMIPWIRKDFFDRNPFGMVSEFAKDFTMQVDDTDMLHYMEKDGSKRSVPIHFTRPFMNRKGEVDVNEKSYDLTFSLMKFTEMAYRTLHARQAEGAANYIREKHLEEGSSLYLVDSKKNLKDASGRDLLDSTTAAANMDVVISDAIDRHVYHIGHKKLLGKTGDKAFKKLMNIHAGRMLGLSVVTAVAGGLGAYLQKRVIDSQERYYSKEHRKNAEKWGIQMIQDKLAGREKGKSGEFVEFFDFLVEGQIEKQLNQALPGFVKKGITERNLYLFYRNSDEAVDVTIGLAAAQNYGWDKNGNLKQLKNLPKGSKSVYERFKKNEDGKWYIEGVDPKEQHYYAGAFQRAVGAMQYRVKGSMPRGEMANYEHYLLRKAAMQFKNWMPGLISERGKDFSYEDVTDTATIGRYRAIGKYFQASKEEQKWVDHIKTIVTKVVPSMLYKMVNTSALLYENPEAAKALQASFNSMEEDVKEYFMEGSGDIEVGLQNYKVFLEKQVTSMAIEIRTILSLISGLVILGQDVGDEDELKDLSWGTRQTYRLIRKLNLEMVFPYNPVELLEISKNPLLPMFSIFIDMTNVLENTIDEIGDEIYGEDSAYEKAGKGHYSINMLKGMRQLRLLTEFMPGDDVLP